MRASRLVREGRAVARSVPELTVSTPSGASRMLREAIAEGRPLLEDLKHSGLADCPYFRSKGTCSHGCWQEPSCWTDEPWEGWPRPWRLYDRRIILHNKRATVDERNYRHGR